MVYEKRMGHSASLLVEALFKYGYRSERSLMLATGLSASHVHYLLRRLQSQGVINGFSIYVDPELFNLNKAYVLYPYPPPPQCKLRGGVNRGLHPLRSVLRSQRSVDEVDRGDLQ